MTTETKRNCVKGLASLGLKLKEAKQLKLTALCLAKASELSEVGPGKSKFLGFSGLCHY
jgi:hypothetical protein